MDGEHGERAGCARDLMGGGVVMDAGGGGASELGLLGGGGSSKLFKHGWGNAAGGDDHGWGSGRAAKQARTIASVVVAGDVVEAAKAAAPFLLGSCSPGHGGEQMLSFSFAAATASSCAASIATSSIGVQAGSSPLPTRAGAQARKDARKKK